MVRTSLVLPAIIIAVAVSVAVLMLMHRPQAEPTAPDAVNAPAPVAATGEGLGPANPPAKAGAAKSEAEEPLPQLVPGNPLTDERFATISAKIVIAAMGLKKDESWEVNTLLYMAKVLEKEGLTEDQYRQYAEALQKHPDRGRAVAQNILDKAEKKIGRRLEMDALPMFKMDAAQVSKIEKQVQKKLK